MKLGEQKTIFDNTYLPPAKNQMAGVLKMLIEGYTDEQQARMNGFRARLSNLRRKHGLHIHAVDVDFTNRYGRRSRFKRHTILEADMKEAIELFKKLNKNENDPIL